jgi:hypothetical protein
MCDESDEMHLAVGEAQSSPGALGVSEIRSEEDLVALGRHLCEIPESRSAHLGSIGYGSTSEGDRVLIAVDLMYDESVVGAVAQALRERGASVDVHWHDCGPDRRFSEEDELGAAIRYRPWVEQPRRWEGNPRIEDRAEREGYDLLVHGRGGPTKPTPFRYEQFPWVVRDHFTPPVVAYPSELIAASSQLTWDAIWKHGRNGRVHVTDLEGSDFSYSLDETYWDGTHHGWVPEPKRWYGHLFAHPTPPLPRADAEGVVKGTTSHFSRAFPRLILQLKDGMVHSVEGGGGYGAAWEDKLQETKEISYPGFSRPGLFHLWEVAIGGHPKVRRPTDIEWWRSGGFEWERRRSGVIHLGFGTFWRGPDEVWAAERGLAYGHLHVHLLFPTLQVHSADGAVHTLIKDGRLTALDDPKVRKLAEKYGNPDSLLREEWVPDIPGITAPGAYEDFAKDPAAFIY